MEILLAGSEVANFKDKYQIGQVVNTKVSGQVNFTANAYELICDGKHTDAGLPICNGIDRDGNKYLVVEDDGELLAYSSNELSIVEGDFDFFLNK